MAFFGPTMDENQFNMVCRNTPHLYEFCDGEENTILTGYARVSKVQKRAARMGQEKA